MVRKMNERVLFRFLVKTKSRIHISSATTGTYDPMRGTTYRYRRQGGGFPLALTKTVPVLLPSVDGTTMLQHVPVMPSTSVRGRLRREAAWIIEDNFLHRGLSISHEVYQAMHCGAVSRSPSGHLLGYDEIMIRMNHVFFGVFGGGARMTPSRLRVRDAYPYVDCLAELGLVEHVSIGGRELVPVSGASVIRDLLAVDHVVRRDDLLFGTDPMAPRIIRDYVDAYQALVVETLKRREMRHEDQDGVDVDRGAGSLGTLAFIEFVPVGVPFVLEVDLRNATDAQVGLAFMALRRFMESGRIGGKGAIGMGRFGCVAAQVMPAMSLKWRGIGGLVDGTMSWDLDEWLEQCLEAAMDEISSMDGESLHHVI